MSGAPYYGQNKTFLTAGVVWWTRVPLNAYQITTVNLRLLANQICLSPKSQPIRVTGALFECRSARRCCYAPDSLLSRNALAKTAQ